MTLSLVPSARPRAAQRTLVAQKTARRLKAAELKIDTALAEALLLGHQMVTGRMAAGFSASVGDQALTSLFEGLNRLGQARTALVQTHACLLEIADEHQVCWRLDGPTETKPVPTIKPTALKAVA